MSDFDHAKERRSKHLKPNPAIEAKAQEKRDRRQARNKALMSTSTSDSAKEESR